MLLRKTYQFSFGEPKTKSVFKHFFFMETKIGRKMNKNLNVMNFSKQQNKQTNYNNYIKILSKSTGHKSLFVTYSIFR